MLLKCPSSSSQIYQNGYSKTVIKDSTEENYEEKKTKTNKTLVCLHLTKRFRKPFYKAAGVNSPV